MMDNSKKQREKISSLWSKFCRGELTFDEYLERKKATIELKYPYEDTYVYRSYQGIR